ncbi:D-glycero-alpha-D-manno-heptose-1,7-bisphosphate 7-phosphatase [Mycolicibacterium sphagni]|uniref:D-glycero-alpha-D-manno-heptose-1,7-bisphosphate 7-phosphatase n=1 Tax=Mycolicibacterium sphagni TaxID=1786 RepID=UPI0021F32C78|nr:HAD family hydrolase [Mycolicibacterium sphagni]MCV7177486.1 HAD family hydrolase [Mycolicibacterium sphagni]
MVAERIDRDWCLFLDRDGVINRQVVGDYVRSWQDFEWIPGAQLALKNLREWAPHLVIVTNQQGVGKGLMSADDLAEIHERMQDELAADGVTIDAFQVCPHLESAGCDCRKPKPGLVLDWLRQHPDCVPSLSIMVGDSQSDLELAHNVAATVGGCESIQIGDHTQLDCCADASFDSLWDFAVAVGQARGEQSS